MDIESPRLGPLTWQEAMSLEPDKVFAEYCLELEPNLFAWLTPDELRLTMSHLLAPLDFTFAKPQQLLYLPVIHPNGQDALADQEGERRMSEELPPLLEKVCRGGWLLAAGESFGEPLTQAGNTKGHKEALFYQDKLAGRRPTPGREEWVHRPPAFEIISCRFAEQHPEIPSGGFEAVPGKSLADILATATGPIFQYLNQVEAERALHRIIAEARTRHNLTMAARRANGMPIVFLQGSGHLESVRGWARRHEVELQEEWPPSVLEDFLARRGHA